MSGNKEKLNNNKKFMHVDHNIFIMTKVLSDRIYISSSHYSVVIQQKIKRVTNRNTYNIWKKNCFYYCINALLTRHNIDCTVVGQYSICLLIESNCVYKKIKSVIFVYQCRFLNLNSIATHCAVSNKMSYDRLHQIVYFFVVVLP